MLGRRARLSAPALTVRPRFRTLAFALTLSGVTLAGRGADAFVRDVTNDQNRQLTWSSSCETLTIYLNGFTAMTLRRGRQVDCRGGRRLGPRRGHLPHRPHGRRWQRPSFFRDLTAVREPVPLRPPLTTETTPSSFRPRWPVGTPCLVSRLATSPRLRHPVDRPTGDIVDVDIEINAVPGCMLVLRWPIFDPGVAPPKHDA